MFSKLCYNSAPQDVFWCSKKSVYFYTVYESNLYVNSFFASINVCCLLITFAKSLDPDQDRQNVFADLYWTTLLTQNQTEP